MGRLPLSQGSKLRTLLASHQDALVCLFDQGVVSVAGFATNVLIGRFAGKSELGVYYIGLTMVLFARGFQQQLVSTPYTIFHHRQEAANLPAYRGSCLVQQAWFLIVTFLYLLLQILVAAFGLNSVVGGSISAAKVLPIGQSGSLSIPSPFKLSQL